MITQQELHGNWNQLKGCLVDKWGQLTEDDLTGAKGSIDRLVGKIQEKTGETKANIESFFDSALENGASRLSGAAEAVRSYASSVSDVTSEQCEHAQEALASGVESATKHGPTSPDGIGRRVLRSRPDRRCGAGPDSAQQSVGAEGMSPSVSDGRNVHASRMRGDNQGARSNFPAKAFNRRPQQTTAYYADLWPRRTFFGLCGLIPTSQYRSRQ
jgi:uncharacterized protein YjbJ (UPF0337 family)